MLINLLLASLFYINAPAIEMREQPKVDSEVVSQAYYSEEAQILKEGKDWVKIETLVDHYQGWVPRTALLGREEQFLTPSSTTAKVNRNAAHLYDVKDTIYGPLLTLPYESKLKVLDQEESNSRWIKVGLVDGREAYIQRGDIVIQPANINREQMCTLSLHFLGLPYTWGGRSSFGYDCSGFVQMLYRQMGILIPRDSKDQIRWNGFTNVALDALTPGDLIYFGLAKDKIRHVGMYLGNKQFIHATVAENAPYIHISNLSDDEWNGFGRFTYVAGRKLAEVRY